LDNESRQKKQEIFMESNLPENCLYTNPKRERGVAPSLTLRVGMLSMGGSMQPQSPELLSPEARLRHACAELAQRLRAGQSADAEQYLQAFPELDPSSAVELIYTEVVVREEMGEELRLEDWLNRFPQWGEPLGRLLRIHWAMRPQAAASAGVSVGPTAVQTARPNDGMSPHGYEIIEELGRGGMGVVYRARQTALNREVALKMILAGPYASQERRARFLNEARTVAKLDHPNIVKIFDVGSHQDYPFLALEYVAGVPLDRLLKDGPLSAVDAAWFAVLMSEAIGYAHREGVIHRDLKPSNVLLRHIRDAGAQESADSPGPLLTYSASFAPVITDFGLAKDLTPEGKEAPDQSTTRRFSAVTATGVLVGTPSYMAPEQTLGTAVVGPPVDIHAVGVILYEMLTGRPPFQGSTIPDTLEQIRTQEPVTPVRLQPGVPVDLATICLKCLEKEPARRYASAQDLADDLRRFLRHEPIVAKPVGWAERFGKWTRRNPGVAALLGGLLLLAAVYIVTVTLLWQSAESARELTSLALQREQTARNEEVEQRKQKETELSLKNLALAELHWSRDEMSQARRCLGEIPIGHRDSRWRYVDRLCNAELFAWKLRSQVVALDVSSTNLLAAIVHSGSTYVWDLRDKTQILYTNQIEPTQRAANLCFRPGETVLTTVVCFAMDFATKRPAYLAINNWNLASKTSGKGGKMSDSYLLPVLSADGRHLAVSPSGSRALHLWDEANPGKMTEIAAPFSVFSMAFSPDAAELATADGDGHLRIWDAKTGKLARKFGPISTRYSVVSYDPSGKHLAVGTYNEYQPPGLIEVRESAQGNLVLTLRGHAGRITVICFSADGRRLATASEDRTVIVWDLEKKDRFLTLRGHTQAVNCLAFSQDGKQLFSGGNDHFVRVWDLSPWE
jgi:serine/threonine protein kinase